MIEDVLKAVFASADQRMVVVVPGQGQTELVLYNRDLRAVVSHNESIAVFVVTSVETRQLVTWGMEPRVEEALHAAAAILDLDTSLGTQAA